LNSNEIATPAGHPRRDGALAAEVGARRAAAAARSRGAAPAQPGLAPRRWFQHGVERTDGGQLVQARGSDPRPAPPRIRRRQALAGRRAGQHPCIDGACIRHALRPADEVAPPPSRMVSDGQRRRPVPGASSMRTRRRRSPARSCA
jgi:hypothetical protein